MKRLRLSSGDLALELLPEIGGSIVEFSLREGDRSLDLMRRATSAPTRPLDTSNFPLVPFSNRIEHGRFDFRGRTGALKPNMGTHPHALHGQGWLTPWSVLESSDTRARLGMRYEPGDWPWTYSAEQVFELDASGLKLRLSVTNTSSEPMPAGLGLHPYFDRNSETRFKAAPSHVWLGSDECIPRELVPVPKGWDFSAGRNFDGIELDHCFSGWDGVFRIEWPDRHLALTVRGDALSRYMVVYVPKGENYFCAEHVSNVNNAINMDERIHGPLGLQVLEPGATLSTLTDFRVERLAR
jgi:aldose 1-epimerase